MVSEQLLQLCTEALAALAQAEAAMTPGPWEWRPATDGSTYCAFLTRVGMECHNGYVMESTATNNEANLTGIAMLRNAAPGLLRRLNRDYARLVKDADEAGIIELAQDLTADGQFPELKAALDALQVVK